MECEILNRRSMESLIYLGYYYPKTQTELATLIYEKPLKKINIKPLVEARVKLMELDYVVQCPKQFKAKNIKYQSNPKPFIELAKSELEGHIAESMRKDQDLFTNKDLRALELILNSNWFRESFASNKAIESRLGYCNVVDRELFKSPTGDLKQLGRLSTNAFQFLAAQLNDISTIAIAFQYSLESLGLPITKVENLDMDFDMFLKSWPEKHNMQDNLELNMLIDKLFNRLLKIFRSPWNKTFFEPLFKTHAFACYPTDLAYKTWKIGRSSRTLWGHTISELNRSMKKIDKSYESPFKSH